MAKKKPLIALTPYFNIERDEPYMRPAYLKAIRAAGGIPLILPLDLEEEDLQQMAFCLPAVRISTLFILGRKHRRTVEMSACGVIVWKYCY